MKRMIVWALALAPATLSAQVADTLHVENAKSVEVISSPGGLSVSVDGTADNPDFHYSNSLSTGMGTASDPDYLNFETPFRKKRNLSHWKLTLLSSEEVSLFGQVIGGEDLFGNAGMREVSGDFGIIGVRYYPGLKNHYISLAWHVGVSSTQRIDGTQRFALKDGSLSLIDYPTGVSEYGKTTDIMRLRYSLPLQYTVIFGNRLEWRAAAGAEMHFNIWNSTRSHYTLSGNHVIEKIDNIKPNLVSLDLMASLSYRGVGVRFRYSPTPVFRSPNGPGYKIWSIGLLLEY